MADWTDLLQRPGQSNGIADFLLNAQNSASQRAEQDAQAKYLLAQTAQKNADAANDQQYQYDVAQYLKNPSPTGFQALSAKYPDKYQALAKGYSAQDEATRSANLGYFGDVYSALNNGRTDLAIAKLQQRRDADLKAGLDTSVDDEWISALTNGDDASKKAAANYVKGAVLAHIGAAAGPEKFGSTYGAVTKPNEGFTLGPGAKRYDSQGNVIAEAPFAPQYRSVGQGDTLYQVGGGGPASGAGGGSSAPLVSNGVQYAPAGRTQYGWTPWQGNGGDNSTEAYVGKINGMAQYLGVGPNDDISKLSPLQIAKALTLSEGGPGSIADKNNNPGNIRNPDGSFKKFPTKEAGLNAAAAQVARNLKRGQTTIATMVGGLPVAGGASAGGAVPIASGAPKALPQKMSPEEVAAEGLDPSMVYYRGADGVPKAVSGQTRPNASAKPWPSKTLDARLTNNASLENINQALALLDPKNNRPEAIAARNATGLGTGALGDWFTNNVSDPQGTAFRALVGQIGGVIIKDISGAAVSATEDARLSKWVPKVTDSPSTVRAKLMNLKRELEIKNRVIDNTAKSQGYRPFAEETGSAPATPASLPRVRSVQQARALPPGTHFLDPNGVERVR